MSFTRREAMEFLLGSLIWNGCNESSRRNGPQLSPDYGLVAAGQLHFYLATDFMNEKEANLMAEGVAAGFAREKILFTGIQVITTFPTLNFLDRIIYVVDTKIMNGKPKDGTELPYGIWGVENTPSYDYLTKLEDRLGAIPYDKILSEANTGLMIADKKVGDKYCSKRKDDYDQHQRLSILINLALHEIGHSFTGNHVCEKRSKSSDPRSCKDPLGRPAPNIQDFHPGNVAKMKSYIREITSDPEHYANAENRLAEWKRRYQQDNDSKNCGVYL